MSQKASVDAFFLEGAKGNLFCIYWHGHPHTHTHVLLVPPFADEMNKCRRQMFLTGQHLAGLGCGVLTLDLFGTGDSHGDFGEATWDGWLNDIRSGIQWLKTQQTAKLKLIGIRTGALLCNGVVSESPREIEQCVFWQPVTLGRLFVNQFLRVAVMADMMRDEQGVSAEQMKQELQDGRSVEVGGYDLNASLAKSLSAAQLVPPKDTSTRFAWVEVASSDKPFSPASAKTIKQYQESSIDLQTCLVIGQPFWSTGEITTAPELIEKTAELLLS